jgi:hypothetical protein
MRTASRSGTASARSAAALVAAALTITCGAGIATPADAAVQALCSGTQTNAYDPGLVNAPRSVDITVSGALSCLSPGDPTITGATIDSAASGLTRSCTSLLNTLQGAQVELSWNTGARSVATVTTTPQFVAGQLVVVQLGTVTSGTFAGATFLGQTAALTDLTQCATPQGITSFRGPWSVEIVL